MPGRNAVWRALATGQPAAVTAFAHIGPLGTIGQHLVELWAAQTIPPPASEAFVFDEGRVLGFGVLGFNQKPAISRARGPIAGWRLPAVAWGEEPGRDFARGRKGSIGRFHSYAVYCLYAVTLRLDRKST